MQHIQWFPGHMTKAMRMMEDNLKLCDGIIYVLDARAPFACINRNLIGLFNNKPVLYLLNKSDLIEKDALNRIITKFAEKNKFAVGTVGSASTSKKFLTTEIKKLLSEKLLQRKEKGISKPLRLMVCGIPNTGKSTIINTIANKKAAQTGDKAGVTKGKQWIKLEDFELLDTPGTMPPSFSNQVYAHHLAYIGSINDDILDKESLSLDFIEEITKISPNCLQEKYKADGETPLEILESIGKNRGYLLRGGVIDYARTSIALFDDFRKGKIGKISLETQEVFDNNG